MKVFAVTCSIVITLFYAAGYYIVFHIEQREVKTQMKQLIRSGRFSEQYEVFSFQKEDFEKMIIDDHEFIHNGNRYDIVRMDQQSSAVIVTCIHDEKEDDLISQLRVTLSGTDSSPEPASSSNAASSLLQFLNTLFITSPADACLSLEQAAMHSFYCLSIYHSPPSAIGNPPPESTLV